MDISGYWRTLKNRHHLSRDHPDRGEIILDVSEGEKAKLSVEDLMVRFYEIQGEAFSSDRMLLV